MKKRIQIDIWIDEVDFTDEIKNILEKKFFQLSKDISEKEKSKIEYHDCGHEDGSKCRNVIEVL